YHRHVGARGAWRGRPAHRISRAASRALSDPAVLRDRAIHGPRRGNRAPRYSVERLRGDPGRRVPECSRAEPLYDRHATRAEGAGVRLLLSVPTGVVVDTPVAKVSGESDRGSFTILPRHADGAMLIRSGLFSYV